MKNIKNVNSVSKTIDTLQVFDCVSNSYNFMTIDIITIKDNRILLRIFHQYHLSPIGYKPVLPMKSNNRLFKHENNNLFEVVNDS